MRYRFLFCLIAFPCTLVHSQEKENDFKVKFDATLKTKYEFAINEGTGRFSVRNSRIGLFGNITSNVTYRAQVELSSEGKFEPLDLNASISLFKGFDVTLGQTSVPVFNSYQTTPAQMLFANRTFLAKYIAGTRDLGILACYKFDVGKTPFYFQLGVFNGSTINKPVWKKNDSYSARLIIGSMKGLRASGKVYRYPMGDKDNYLITAFDLRYGQDRYKIETEVLNRHNYYNGINRFASYIQGAYSFPLTNLRLFKNFTTSVRWDGITESAVTNGFDVNRLTFGLAFGLTSKPFNSLVRLDYENYFVKKAIPEFSLYNEVDSDKITLELLVVF
ncbi:MAG: porin [Bacteroidales bacterium]|jgi:hypothetical protein